MEQIIYTNSEFKEVSKETALSNGTYTASFRKNGRNIREEHFVNSNLVHIDAWLKDEKLVTDFLKHNYHKSSGGITVHTKTDERNGYEIWKSKYLGGIGDNQTEYQIILSEKPLEFICEWSYDETKKLIWDIIKWVWDDGERRILFSYSDNGELAQFNDTYMNEVFQKNSETNHFSNYLDSFHSFYKNDSIEIPDTPYFIGEFMR